MCLDMKLIIEVHMGMCLNIKLKIEAHMGYVFSHEVNNRDTYEACV